MGTMQISVSEFKAQCTALLRDLDSHPKRIEVTNRGRVIAIVSPPVSERTASPAEWLGSLRGSVLHYEAPFAPAAEAAEWNALSD